MDQSSWKSKGAYLEVLRSGHPQQELSFGIRDYRVGLSLSCLI